MTRTADPHRNYKFKIVVPGFNEVWCKSVSGLKAEVEVIEHRDGGDMATPRKIAGQGSYENIVLSRGVASDTDFYDWYKQVFDRSAGYNQSEDYRKRTITIELYSRPGLRAKQWKVNYAWPCNIEFDDLEGDGNDVLFHSIEICHEGWSLITYDSV